MNLNNFLPGISFTFLLLLMLLYWLQAAFFGKERYKSLNNFMSLLSLTSLTVLLTVRWIESRHFPLSNLYESLLFLSWCFLSLKILLAFDTKEIKKRLPNSLYMQSFALQPFDITLTPPSMMPLPVEHERTKRSFDDQYTSAKGRFVRNQAQSKAKKAELCAQEGERKDVVCMAVQTTPNTTDASARALHEKRFDAHAISCLEEEKKAEQDTSLGLGVVLSPAALLTFGFAFLSLPKEMQKATTLVPALQSNWLMMHVTVMVLSYAALLSGSLLSIVFLILSSLQGANSTCAESTYKASVSAPTPKSISSTFYTSKNNVRGVSTVLSLTDKLDNYSYRILALGFPLLTIGILSGAVWANEAWGSYWSWDPKETWALITWLVFAIYLHTRIKRGWGGKKSAIVASAGFFVVWFCYLGVNLLGTGLHSYGWFSK